MHKCTIFKAIWKLKDNQKTNKQTEKLRWYNFETLFTTQTISMYAVEKEEKTDTDVSQSASQLSEWVSMWNTANVLVTAIHMWKNEMDAKRTSERKWLNTPHARQIEYGAVCITSNIHTCSYTRPYESRCRIGARYTSHWHCYRHNNILVCLFCDVTSPHTHDDF